MVTPVSTSADVVRNVVALLIAVGDVAAANDGSGGTMRVYHGEEYLDTNDTPPRLVCVLGEDGGDLGGVLEIGARQVASWSEGISFHVWGAGPSDDSRLDDAMARADRIVNCLAASAPGRRRGKLYTREQNPKILKHGEELVFRISYTRPVPYDDQVFAAAYALAPTPALSPPNPDQPQGSTGLSFATVPTLSTTRST